VTAGLGVPSTLTWNGSSGTASEALAGVARFGGGALADDPGRRRVAMVIAAVLVVTAGRDSAPAAG
jgi:nitrate/nitrite transporter NarK